MATVGRERGREREGMEGEGGSDRGREGGVRRERGMEGEGRSGYITVRH